MTNEKKPFYVDVVHDGNDIITWIRGHDGDLFTRLEKESDFTYAFTPANDGRTHPHRNIYGDMMKRVDFSSYYQMSKHFDGRSDVCESDIPPKTRYMLDMFHDADLESPINIGYYDIEVDYNLDDGLGFPTPENPHGEVNSFQMYDKSRDTYVMIWMDHLKGKIRIDADRPIEMYFVSDEKDMLETIADVIDDLDLLGGWYTSGFDLPYLMARALENFPEDKALSLFCRNGFPAKKREFVDDNGMDQVEWTLVGRQHVDLLHLYKKFVPKERDSFSLDAVCEDELGEKKVAYVGDLGDLYRSNPQKWCEYAFQDARLLRMLDEKKRILDMAITMSRESCVMISEVSGTVKPIENAFIKFCRNKGNIVLPNKKEHGKEKFDGAIVYDTLAGYHMWSMSVDLTALYPSAMIMLGLSTETLVFQCSGGYDDFINITTQRDVDVEITFEKDNRTEVMTAKEIHEMIKRNGYTISANGTVFDGSLGLLSEFVKYIFDKRVKQKAEAKKYLKAGDNYRASQFDLLQSVTKIFANSLYGCIGNNYFRLFDLRMAMSITLTGQVISKVQMSSVNELLRKFEE